MVDLQRPPTTSATKPLAHAIKHLWWGAIIVCVEFKVAGWDISND